jgi:hypothetical protein
VVGPFGSQQDALRASAEANFDVALLKVDLDGEPVWPIADALADGGIPFVFTTTFESHMIAPNRHADRPIVCRPCQPEDLIGAISRTMSPKSRPALHRRTICIFALHSWRVTVSLARWRPLYSCQRP